MRHVYQAGVAAAGQENRRRALGRWGRRLSAVSAAALCLALAGCGGRTANPTATANTLDTRLSCAHLSAEKAANLRRLEDLDDERDENRIRSLTRVPGAIIGNPISAIVLADPSLAIYEEEAAIERRNARIDALTAEKACGAAPADSRQAAVTPIDDAAFDLYAAQYEAVTPQEQLAVDQNLAAPQPEIDPEVLASEEAEAATAPVAEAERRDDAAAAAYAAASEDGVAPLR